LIFEWPMKNPAEAGFSEYGPNAQKAISPCANRH
jgi:hypothetical protein